MKSLIVVLCSFIICACTSVTVETPVGYKLSAKSTKRFANRASNKTLLVSEPNAAAGYESNEMRYVIRQYQLDSFVNNQWVTKPKEMLSPLLVQSLQNTGYFKAVVPSTFIGDADLRLDTEILLLQQDFLVKPSREQFSIKAALFDEKTKKIIATQVFTVNQASKVEGPYGGVVAANIALKKILEKMMPFVVSNAKRS